MRDQLVTTLFATLPLVGAWLAVQLRRYLAQRLYAAHVASIQVRARAVAADLEREVEQAKDPARPGAWTAELAAETRAAAVRRVKRLEPLACRVILDALDGDTGALDDLVGTHVEEGVRALRAAAVTPNSRTERTPTP